METTAIETTAEALETDPAQLAREATAAYRALVFRVAMHGGTVDDAARQTIMLAGASAADFAADVQLVKDRRQSTADLQEVEERWATFRRDHDAKVAAGTTARQRPETLDREHAAARAALDRENVAERQNDTVTGSQIGGAKQRAILKLLADTTREGGDPQQPEAAKLSID